MDLHMAFMIVSVLLLVFFAWKWYTTAPCAKCAECKDCPTCEKCVECKECPPCKECVWEEVCKIAPTPTPESQAEEDQLIADVLSKSYVGSADELQAAADAIDAEVNTVISGDVDTTPITTDDPLPMAEIIEEPKIDNVLDRVNHTVEPDGTVIVDDRNLDSYASGMVITADGAEVYLKSSKTDKAELVYKAVQTEDGRVFAQLWTTGKYVQVRADDSIYLLNTATQEKQTITFGNSKFDAFTVGGSCGSSHMTEALTTVRDADRKITYLLGGGFASEKVQSIHDALRDIVATVITTYHPSYTNKVLDIVMEMGLANIDKLKGSSVCADALAGLEAIENILKNEGPAEVRSVSSRGTYKKFLEKDAVGKVIYLTHPRGNLQPELALLMDLIINQPDKYYALVEAVMTYLRAKNQELCSSGELNKPLLKAELARVVARVKSIDPEHMTTLVMMVANFIMHIAIDGDQVKVPPIAPSPEPVPVIMPVEEVVEPNPMPVEDAPSLAPVADAEPQMLNVA